ncbi:hypothetical protein [Amycolatopsis sp. NPDC004079]|uniref:hypothetical protein n=1 Tax=Amycolatopsis sp. NPDC004079 TaxID=3154549 RepID=UPI0033ABEC77
METTVYRVWAPLGTAPDGRPSWLAVSTTFIDRDEAEEWASHLNSEHRVEDDER